MNYCDHGHAIRGEVRSLPLGGNANVHVCKHHYHVELQARLNSNAWDKGNAKHYPAWELLRVHEERI